MIASPHINLGLLLAAAGQADEAIAEYRQALAMDSHSVRLPAHANLGLALAQLNRFDEAREHLHLALEMNPQAVVARCGLALLLTSRRQDR